MANREDSDNNEFRPTRKMLFNKLVQKEIKPKLGEEFKNGIDETLEEILGVSKASLSVAETKKFNEEANEFYSYVPRCLAKANRDKNRMKARFKKYFDKEISLETRYVFHITVLCAAASGLCRMILFICANRQCNFIIKCVHLHRVPIWKLEWLAEWKQWT